MSRRIKPKAEKNFDYAMGARIRSIRGSDISVNQAAAILGCNRNRYRDIEDGKSSLSAWECSIIADTYKISPNKLFGKLNLEKFDYAHDVAKVLNNIPTQYRELYVEIGRMLIDYDRQVNGESSEKKDEVEKKGTIKINKNNKNKEKTKKRNIIYFWGTREEHGYLSNWYKSKFIVQDIEYSCVEQFMMYKKAILFEDTLTGKKILSAKSPATIKKLGKSVTPFIESIWKEKREEIVYEGIRAKFEQNPELLQKLLATGDAMLVEASPQDSIWGIGLSAAEARRVSPDKWEGENLLGKILMRVREDLANSTK